MVHVRFEGRSYDLDERNLQSNGSGVLNEADIRERLAQHFDIALSRLDGYVVDRLPGGDIIVRPESVYG